MEVKLSCQEINLMTEIVEMILNDIAVDSKQRKILIKWLEEFKNNGIG